MKSFRKNMPGGSRGKGQWFNYLPGQEGQQGGQMDGDLLEQGEEVLDIQGKTVAQVSTPSPLLSNHSTLPAPGSPPVQEAQSKSVSDPSPPAPDNAHVQEGQSQGVSSPVYSLDHPSHQTRTPTQPPDSGTQGVQSGGLVCQGCGRGDFWQDCNGQLWCVHCTPPSDHTQMGQLR